MNSHPPHRRPGIFGRPVLTVAIVLAVLAALGIGGVAFANRSPGDSAAQWREGPASPSSPASSAPAAPPPTESATVDEGAVTLSATGDIMMSNAPNRMPPANGEGFFDSVKAALASDLVMGNLEQPLTENTGASKCGSPPSPNCFAFRSPPAYVKHLSDGGFDLVNTANNHAKDFGTQGARNTRATLDEAGIKATGNTDEITVAEVKGVKIAVVGFSSYAGANSLIDLDQARSVVESAKGQADLVVVQVHMGAEGSEKQHVRPGTETFHGENRGDPIKFSHAVVDAGADLVVGHGPHVLRGMEFYNGKLIAYSLGNFAGGGRTLSRGGVLKYGGILQVTLGKDGSYGGGKLLSTYMNDNGLPTRDESNEQGRKLVAQLSKQDFPDTGVKIGADGSITPSA
ncbi:CapA family protein [Paractinoplanes lichenicola]|uniref:CapA family protein n=1 Tax=Paractinoplanes lichenicola TaxID=2802976 RepID=A0ABS1W547_9ACTN|nr:CapA family protein [Actinoplanes lichenicola]MBL7261869.1 CapA family protein [Actinoplanes lichenicola]